MSTLAEVATRVRAVLDTCVRARQALLTATEPLEAAGRRLSELLQGSGDADAAQASALMSRAATKVAETRQILTDAEVLIRGFLAGLGLDAGDHTTTASTRPPPDRIEQLRGELPPPVVRGSGQKTHGRWITPDGTARPMTSGRDHLSDKVNEVLRSQNCPRLPARAADDVELKLAALMREQGPGGPANAEPHGRHQQSTLQR